MNTMSEETTGQPEAVPQFELYGRKFHATEEAIGAMLCFKEGEPEASDTGPFGMVEEMKNFVAMTRDKKYLLDIGALYGVFSLVFTADREPDEEEPQRRAVALEPSGEAMEVLRQQRQLNPDKNISALQIFAGEQVGRQVSCYKDWRHLVAGKGQGSTEEVVVTELPIDALFACPDVMKIDVEGYECAVLRGARKTIEANRPLIFLEVHGGSLEQHGESLETLWQIIADYGYVVHSYGGLVHKTAEEIQGMPRVVCVHESELYEGRAVN